MFLQHKFSTLLQACDYYSAEWSVVITALSPVRMNFEPAEFPVRITDSKFTDLSVYLSREKLFASKIQKTGQMQVYGLAENAHK